MLFEVPLVDILPLIKCKPEAETIVALKISLLKLGHFLDAFSACDAHRQTLIRLRGVAAAAATSALSAKTKGQKKQEQEDEDIASSRVATLHSILDTTITTIETTDNKDLKNEISQLLKGLYHIERSLHQYAIQNKSLSQELKYSGYDQLAEEKLKLFGVENSLCGKLRGVLALSQSSQATDVAKLHTLLNKRISRSNVKRPLDTNALLTSETTKQMKCNEKGSGKTDDNTIEITTTATKITTMTTKNNNNNIISYVDKDDMTYLTSAQPPLSVPVVSKIKSPNYDSNNDGNNNLSYADSSQQDSSPLFLENTETDCGEESSHSHSQDSSISSSHAHLHPSVAVTTVAEAAHMMNSQNSQDSQNNYEPQLQQRGGDLTRRLSNQSRSHSQQSNSFSSTPSPEIKINPNNGVFSSHKQAIQFRDDTSIQLKNESRILIAAPNTGGDATSSLNGRTHTV